MKINLNYFKISLILFTALFAASCSTDTDMAEDNAAEDSFTVAALKANTTALEKSASAEEACFSVNLIAGQHTIVGDVSVALNDDGTWQLTYTTFNDWEIDETHLSLSSSCENPTFPVTNSGNPKVGKFEYSSTHKNSVNTVTYTIYQENFDYQFCFAAHAVVSGPQGNETAWAEGESFGGKSWAMFVPADLYLCLNAS